MENILSSLGILGGTCTFLYFMFEKFTDKIERDINHLSEEMKDQRKRTDQLYEIVINILSKGIK